MAAPLILFPCRSQAAEILKLGFVSSLSDVAASRGQDIVEGFKLGLKSLGGRLGGVETDLIVVDDQSRTETAASAAKRMAEREHVHVITGLATPEITLAVANAVKGEGGPLVVSPAFGPVALAGADCRQGFFSLVPSDEAFAEAVARGLKGDNGQIRIAAVVAKAFRRGQGQAEALKAFLPDVMLLEAEPGELVFDAQMKSIQAEHSQGIAVFLGGGVGIGFLRQLRVRQLKEGKTVFADWPLMEPAHMTALGDAALGLRSIAPWADDAENPVSHKFVSDFEDEHRSLPSSYAALGYDLALLLDQAVKNMGGRVADRSSFARALANAQVQGTRGLIRFGNNHFAQAPLHLREGMRDAKGRLLAGHKASLAPPADRHAQACRLAAPEPVVEEAAPVKKKR